MLVNKQDYFNLMNVMYTDKINRITAAGSSAVLTLLNLYSIVTTAAGTHTCYLPSVAEAVGLTFTIRLVTAGNNLTVADNDDSLDWSDLTLDTAEDFCVLFSDGQKWHVLESDTA